MANYSPQHFEPRAKAVNVKGVANRAVATVLTAGLIAQPLMSPLAAIAAPSTDNGDSVQGGSLSSPLVPCRSFRTSQKYVCTVSAVPL